MKELEEWNNHLLERYNYYNKLILDDSVNGAKFQGFKVWYSNNIITPQILLLGINPGGKEGGLTKPINLGFSLELEYLADKHNYTLALQVKKAFANAGILNVLENSTMKTNFYHLITPKMNDLGLLGKIQKGLRKEYEADSEYIIKNLINIIKPKYVICEGSSVFWKFVGLHGSSEQLDWKDDCGYCVIDSSMPVILGFSRRRSYIKNINAFSKLLQTNVKITHFKELF